MVLSVLGSSSSGNAYVLQNAGEALLIEAGINFKKVVTALEGNISKVVGCLITHEHGDPVSFREKVYRATGKRVHIAAPGLSINFNKTPF